MAYFMDLDNFIGVMVVFTKENLLKVKNMDMVFGVKVIQMKNTKASFYKIEKKVMEFILGIMAMFTKDIIKQISGMAKDKCSGLMAHFIKELGWLTNRMEREISLMEWKSPKELSKTDNWLILINLNNKEEEFHSFILTQRQQKE